MNLKNKITMLFFLSIVVAIIIVGCVVATETKPEFTFSVEPISAGTLTQVTININGITNVSEYTTNSVQRIQLSYIDSSRFTPTELLIPTNWTEIMETGWIFNNTTNKVVITFAGIPVTAVNYVGVNIPANIFKETGGTITNKLTQIPKRVQ